MDGLTAAEQREFQSRMERKQMKEFMGVSLPSRFVPYLERHVGITVRERGFSLTITIISWASLAMQSPQFKLHIYSGKILPSLAMFSGLVNHCFESCVDDFTTKSLVQRETGCVTRCVKKFMAGSERIGQRFQEQQAQMMQQPPPGK
ncbi:Tim10/DDP family zinc finger protein [Amylocarpus encephaloides]|uniref:Mitochondrial import inner membrane translocase subunit n=1 Tax=Amylocarpus encephaloides TaxID=45428 RepID=A0A9P7YTK3_9HELO|nr:Tim10/DDP family zinc finger protein [Amylocarpus encephaloides]